MADDLKINDPAIISVLLKGPGRRAEMEALHRDGQADERAVRTKLIGLRYKGFREQIYEITDVRYGWDGYLHARGYKIIKSGKRGNKTWDIGRIIAFGFE